MERIEHALGKPLAECFAEFDANPLAAASVAQVHGARLPDGADVVVKVLRPGIELTIAQDLKILHHVATLAGSLVPQRPTAQTRRSGGGI